MILHCRSWNYSRIRRIEIINHALQLFLSTLTFSSSSYLRFGAQPLLPLLLHISLVHPSEEEEEAILKRLILRFRMIRLRRKSGRGGLRCIVRVSFLPFPFSYLVFSKKKKKPPSSFPSESHVHLTKKTIPFRFSSLLPFNYQSNLNTHSLTHTHTHTQSAPPSKPSATNASSTVLPLPHLPPPDQTQEIGTN